MSPRTAPPTPDQLLLPSHTFGVRVPQGGCVFTTDSDSSGPYVRWVHSHASTDPCALHPRGLAWVIRWRADP